MSKIANGHSMAATCGIIFNFPVFTGIVALLICMIQQNVTEFTLSHRSVFRTLSNIDNTEFCKMFGRLQQLTAFANHLRLNVCKCFEYVRIFKPFVSQKLRSELKNSRAVLLTLVFSKVLILREKNCHFRQGKCLIAKYLTKLTLSSIFSS